MKGNQTVKKCEHHVFYGSILSEFLRLAKFTLKLSDLVPKAKKLFLRMMN